MVDWVLLADRVVAFVLPAKASHRNVEIVVVKIAVNFHRHSLLGLGACAVAWRRRKGFYERTVWDPDDIQQYNAMNSISSG